MGRAACMPVWKVPGVAHIYEEFSDNHSSIDYRLDKTLPWMARLLSEEEER